MPRLRAVLLAVLLLLPAAPAGAYHDANLGGRVRYCSTLAYALVE